MSGLKPLIETAKLVPRQACFRTLAVPAWRP
ncbi:hypothetical protein MNBD_ALPHA11-1982, partial [hydrothermal vent metagenome]